MDARGPRTLGVRPEHLHVCDSKDKHVTLAVEAVEPLGADTLVHGTLDASETHLVLRLPEAGQQDRPQVGHELALRFDTARLHWFEPESGRRDASMDRH